jgi:hypothetical protein
VLRPVVRYRFVLAAVVFLLVGLVGDHDEGDLLFFDVARHALFGSAGLHLYALRPNIQIGPVALLGVIGANDLFGGQLTIAVVATAALMLVLTLRSAEQLAIEAGVDPERVRIAVAIGGLVLAACWAVAVPGWGHPDDLAALLALTASLRAARNGRGLRAGLLLAVGVDCKPWAGFAVAVILVLAQPRQRLRAAASLVGGVAVCWVPFLVAAPATLASLARFQIPANPFSVPGLFGATETPHWTRLAQLVLATLAVVVCVQLGRWELTLLVVAIGRLALDGGAYPYYDVELVAGCLVADVVGARWGASLLSACAPLTCASLVGMDVVRQISLSPVAVPLRLGLYAVLLSAASLRHGRPSVTAAVELREVAVPTAVA